MIPKNVERFFENENIFQVSDRSKNILIVVGSHLD